MQYRTKLFVLVASIVLFTNGAVLLTSYFKARSLVLEELHSKATSIAASTAKMINGDALATLKSRGDEDSVAYSTLERTLRAVRDTNRRQDVQVEHVYTLMRSPDNHDQLLFGVDSEPYAKFKSHVGDVYAAGTNKGLSKHLEQAYSDPGFGADGWASWVSGYAPVYNGNGKFVGAIGVGLGTDKALATLNGYLFAGLAQIALLVGVAMVVTLQFVRRTGGKTIASQEQPRSSSQSSSGLRRAA